MISLLSIHPRKVSRDVTPEDYPYLQKIRKEWQELCFQPIGRVRSALAIAHVQIEANDPIRAFMRVDGTLFINPKIVDVEDPTTHLEGCMTWPYRDFKKVKRYGRVFVEGIRLSQKGKAVGFMEWFDGKEAFIFQHEIGHFNLNTLY